VLSGGSLHLCYVDESGGFEPPGIRPDATPLMVIAGVIFEHSRLESLTADFLDLRCAFYPSAKPKRGGPHRILDEVKGSDIRAALRASRRNARRATTFLTRVVELLEENQAKIVGRVWVKAPGKGMKPTESYTFAIQDIAGHFNHMLGAVGSIGVLLCDGREYSQDREVSHSIFTGRHRASGNAYPNLIESPVFGDSLNHVGLQLADIVASSLIYPMAVATYCPAHLAGLKNGSAFLDLKAGLGPRHSNLRHIYRSADGLKRCGGVVVSDPIGFQSSGQLFKT
jgi:hypothetical protein